MSTKPSPLSSWIRSGIVLLLGLFPALLRAQSTFPANAIDTQGLTWTTGGAAAWVSDSLIKRDVFSARSGAIGNGTSTWIKTTLTGPAQIAFHWKVSSERGWDFLKLYVDDVMIQQISGSEDWTEVKHSITKSGPVTVTFVYEKDGSSFYGDDAGWVDSFTASEAGTWSQAMNGFMGLPYSTSSRSDWAANPSWVVDTATSRDGTSVRSGKIGDSATSAIELPGVPGGQTVSWYVRTSSETDFDFFKFFVNDIEIAALRRSGLTDWTQQSHILPAGTHRLRWVYQKDGSANRNEDAVWIDSVVLAYPPVFVQMPTGGTNTVGSTLRLSARGGGGTGTTVTWRRNNTIVANGGRVSGADTLNLVVENVSMADAGDYTVTLNNPYGTVTSPVATVLIPVPPSVTTAPVATTLNAGQALNLSVTATGSAPLIYQWRRNNVDIPGAVASSYSVPSVGLADGGTYTVVVSNPFGSVTSSGATVVVQVAPTITTQPVAATGALGKSVTFAVLAQSSLQPLTYQWRKGGVNLSNGTRVSGSTSAQLTLSALEAGDAGQYSVVVANTSGSVTSASAALTVVPFNLTPTLNTIANVTRLEDATATTVALGGIGDGNGNTQTLTVTATSSDTSVVPHPTVTYTSPQATGSLSVGNVAGKSGSATITVRVKDNGGTVSGGVDSVERQFVVTVTPVNDPPVMATATFPTVLDRRQPVVVAQDFSIDTSGGTLWGGAARITSPNASLQLTASTTGQSGAYALDALHPTEATAGFRARFRLWVGDVVDSTSSTQPTGVSLNFLPEDPASVSLANAGRGVGNGLSVGFVPVAGTGGAIPHVVLRVGGVEIARTNYSILSKGTASAPPWVEVVMTADRRVSVSHDGTVLFDSVATSLSPLPGWRFLWAASTDNPSRATQIIDEILVASLPLSHLGPVLAPVGQSPANILVPTDPIVSTGGSSPSGQEVAKAIDGLTTTQYQNTTKAFSGFTVTPAVGATVVSGITLTTATDRPERDPASWQLLGSNDGVQFELIASGDLAPLATRQSPRTVNFPNVRPYTRYKVVFPAVVTPASATAVQIGEVALLGFRAISVPLSGLGDGDDGSQSLTVTATSSNPLVIGSPQVVYVRPQTTATLLLPEPPVGANGTAVVSVRVQDTGGTANEGSDVATFTHNLQVVPVNQAPTLNPLTTVTVDTTSGAGTQTVPLQGLGAGSDVLARGLTVTAVSSVTSTIPSPTVTYTSPATTGSLLVNVPQGRSGTAVVTVTVQDSAGTANGGVDTTTRTFTVRAGPQPPLIDVAPESQIVRVGDTVTFSVVASGVGLSYQWSKDGTSISGATASTLTLPAAAVADVGTYTVRVSNANLENINPTASATLTVVQSPVSSVVKSTQQAQFSGTVTLPSGASATYAWLKDGQVIPGATSASYTLPSATTDTVGSYVLRVTVGSKTFDAPPVTLRLMTPLAGLYSTGVDDQGVRLADRASDPHYTLIDPSPVTGSPVAVTTAGTFPIPPWIVGDSGSAWISPSARLREPGSSAGTLYTYRTTVDLSGVQLSSVRIAGQVAADDTLTAIRLNGVDLSLPADTAPGVYKTFDYRPTSTRGQDRFVNRGTLVGEHVAGVGNTTGAGRDVGEPPLYPTGTHGSGPSIWWRWVAPKSGTVIVKSTGSTISTMLGAYEGTQLTGLTLLARTDGDGAAYTQERWVSFRAVEGREYAFTLAGYQAARGEVRLVVQMGSVGPEGSDSFALRGTIDNSANTARATGNNVAATSETGEPAVPNGLQKTIWWRWVAPKSGSVTINTFGSSFDTILEVLSNSTLASLSRVAINDDPGTGYYRDINVSPNFWSAVTFTATQGTEYQIRVDAYYLKAGGNVVLNLIQGSDPNPIVSSGDLVQGLNTLDFVVRNSAEPGLDRGLTGLRVQFADTEGVANPVEIVTAPTGGTELYGNKKTFSVGALSSGTTTYQWFRDGLAIPGADEAELSFNLLEEGDAGSYRVRVSNINGVTWSDPVDFKVDVPLTISRQPVDTSVGVGGSASFNVRFRGNAPLGVQWHFNDRPLAGATSTTLTLTDVSVAQAGRYQAVVRDRDGTLDSADAVLTVVEPPVLVQEPRDYQGVAGRSRLQLEAIVDGSEPMVHRWFRNGVPLAVANSPILDLGILRESQAGTYHLVVTNLAGAVTSRTATVTVHLPPALSATTGNVKAYEGETGNFSVTATGSGQLEYRWFAGTTELIGQNGSSLALEKLSRSYTGPVSVVVSSPYGSFTNSYELEVYPAPVPVVSTGTDMVQTFVLKPGWNALFLEVQPDDNTVQAVFGSVPYTSLWRWSDPRTGPQFISDQSEAALDKAQWQIHLPATRPESFQNNLIRMFRHEAYLLRLDGTTDVTLQVTGKPGYPRARWAIDAYTLTGFMVDDTVLTMAPAGTDPRPTVRQFLGASAAHFDAVAGQPRGVYRLAPNGTWTQLGATDRLSRGVAYWVFTKGSSDYVAPLEAEIPGLDELRYPFGVATREVTLRFRTNGFSAVLGHLLDDQSLPLQVNEFDPAAAHAWRDLPNGYGVESRGLSTRTIRLAAKRERIPDLNYGGILTLRGGGALHRIPVTVERDDPNAGAVVGKPFNPVGLWLGSISVTHVSEVNGLTTNYVVTPITNQVDGVTTIVEQATTEVRNVTQGSLPTPVRDPFEMRMILHSGTDGTTRILQQVTVMNRPPVVGPATGGVNAVSGGEAVLLSDPTRVSKFNGVALRGRDSVGRRFSTPFFPMYNTNGVPFDGTLGLGRRITASWALPADAPLNPFRHKYHPDHDNLDARFKAFKQEAFPVRRTVQLEIPERQGSNQSPGRGQDEIEGVFTETLEGLHRVPITVRGTFTLKRLLPVGDLNPD